MAEIPDNEDTGQNRQPDDSRRTGPVRHPDDRKPTGPARRPGQRRPSTGPKRRPTTSKRVRRGDKQTNPQRQRPQKKRQTGIFSLEPPSRNRGPRLGNTGTRLDAMAPGKTKDDRNKALFGNVGRENRPGQLTPRGGTEGKRPRVRRISVRNGAVDLGASKESVDSMLVRRKTTRRIPKKDGTGFEGDTAALDSMGSDRRPAVPPQGRGTGPVDGDVPPVVDMPVPRGEVKSGDQGPAPSGKGNTLAGVSAEDLLGEEGRQLLENIRRREAEERQADANASLSPGTTDSSRETFQSAEYGDGAAAEGVAESDVLTPQGSFLEGPTRRVERNVVQTPMSADQQSPPAAEDENEPVARESAAHDEMEQRAGYLLWLQGVITREEVEDAMLSAGQISEPIQDLLANNTFTDQITLYRFLSRHECIAPVDLEEVEPSERALAALRPSIARSYHVLPIEKLGELLIVATTFPFDSKRLLELRSLTSSKVKIYIVTEEELDAALKKYYPASQDTQRSPPAGGGIDTPPGNVLEQRYDPTLSGEESGLYSPLDGPASDSQPPADVAISEVDEHGSGLRDTLDNEALAAAGDLDESTLGTDYELDPGDDDAPDDDRDDALDKGPEELDPFAD